LIKTVFRRAGIPVLAISALAIFLLSSAPAAGAAPYEHRACTYGSSSGNVQTCMSWNNSGTHIDSILGSALVINAGRTIEVCIRGPVGTLKCDNQGYIYIGPNTSVSVLWSPNATEPAGTYCLHTWRLNSDGSVTEIGDICTVIS
jgi:hypothetical protein